MNGYNIYCIYELGIARNVCFFSLLKKKKRKKERKKENKDIDIYKSWNVSLSKANPLYAHYTGTTVIRKEWQGMFFKDKLL